MSAQSALVGWQLLHKLIEKDIKSEADIIVAISHWFFIKQGEFQCLGVGDQVSSYFLLALVFVNLYSNFFALIILFDCIFCFS